MADAELKTFLGLVEEGRGEAFIDSIIVILKANDVERPCHLRKLVEGNVNYGDAAVTAGKRGFVAAAIEAAAAEFSPGASQPALAVSSDPYGQHERLSRIEDAFVNFAGQNKKEKVPVDIAKGLEEHALLDLLPVEAWPEMKPTVELATKLKLMRTRCGHDCVILFADLRKYVLPSVFAHILFVFSLVAGSCPTLGRATSGWPTMRMRPKARARAGSRRAVHHLIWPCGLWLGSVTRLPL